MDIYIAAQAGACYGVQRALDLVDKHAEADKKIHTLGPLIHNPLVVADLDRRGIEVAQAPQDINAGTVVIRSHGVAPQIIEEMRDKGLEVVDATCPYVKKVQKAAAQLVQDGYQVILVGEKGHPEVEGIFAHTNNTALVVTSVDELLDKKISKKVGVVVQTTQSLQALNNIINYLITCVPTLKIHNTICEATAQRQQAAAQLAQKVDAMIVIGGKNSGNTRRLYEICHALRPHTYHIEHYSEVSPDWLEGIDSLGITAGASTPAVHIEQLCSHISTLTHNDVTIHFLRKE